MDFIKRNDEILLIWDDSFDLESSQLSAESIKKDFEASIITEKIHHVSLGKRRISDFFFAFFPATDTKRDKINDA